MSTLRHPDPSCFFDFGSAEKKHLEDIMALASGCYRRRVQGNTEGDSWIQKLDSDA